MFLSVPTDWPYWLSIIVIFLRHCMMHIEILNDNWSRIFPFTCFQIPLIIWHHFQSDIDGNGTLKLINQMSAATYCSSSWIDNELLVLYMMKNILDFVYLQYQRSSYKLLLTPTFIIVLSVLQDKLDHLTNCKFTEHLRLTFSLKWIGI
jgi:hypothetical protein